MQKSSLQRGSLQGFFDLNYDKIDKCKEYYVCLALETGVDITDLGTIKVPDMDDAIYLLRRNPS
jgi:hypothetical protein